MTDDGKIFVEGITSWPIASIHWEPIGKLQTDYLRAKLEAIARDAEDLWQWMEGGKGK